MILTVHLIGRRTTSSWITLSALIKHLLRLQAKKLPSQRNLVEDLAEMTDRGHPALEGREMAEEREVEGEEEDGHLQKDQSSQAVGEEETRAGREINRTTKLG